MEKDSKETPKADPVLKSGDKAPEVKAATQEVAPVSKTGKTIIVGPGEVLVLEKQSGLPFAVSKKLWDDVYSKQPTKFELKKT